MMDVNERTSVPPYGKEVKVFSFPNCYLSETECFLTVSSSSFSSKTPAFSAKTRENTLRSQMPSLILENSPKGREFGMLIRQASDDSLSLESLKSLSDVFLLYPSGNQDSF